MQIKKTIEGNELIYSVNGKEKARFPIFLKDKTHVHINRASGSVSRRKIPLTELD